MVQTRSATARAAAAESNRETSSSSINPPSTELSTTSHSNEIYTYANPRYQEFSLPTSIIRYLIRNPDITHAMYDKLVKTCKWFYYRYRLNFEEKTIRTQLRPAVEIFEEYRGWNIPGSTNKVNVIRTVVKTQLDHDITLVEGG